MNVRQDILWRVWLTFGMLGLFACVIFFYAFKIQVIEGKKWKDMSDSLVENKTIEATRGNIFDCNGNLLATSIPIYEVRLDMNAEGITDVLFKEKIDSLSTMLSRLFNDKSAAEYKTLLSNARKHRERYLLLKDKLDYNYVKELKSFPLFRLGRYKGGFMVEQESMRLRPFKHLASRTIGYVSDDKVKVGLEGYFDKELTGVNGTRLMRRISGGVWMPLNDENEVEPENGKDIVTTLDVNLQDVAEHALYNALEVNNADHGCAILMEVETGAIKALANLQRKENGEIVESFNYAIGDNSEPGSTFKLISVMSLLEDKLADINDSTSTEGGEKVYGKETMRDSEKGGYGIVSLQKAFEKSSNVAISKFVMKAYSKDPSKFTDHIIRLGLNKKLGIQLDGEANPLVKTPADKKIWSGTSLPWMSIGYEVNITPLQMITIYNAVANNGRMMKPLLVNEIHSIGKKPERIAPQVLQEKICSDETLAKLHEMLRGVVESGTARNLKNNHYSVAGKTGTALVADKNLGYKNKIYQASFVGFFPAVKPKYTCMVVIRNPRAGVYYGALVAGPVFKEIADKVYSLNTDIQVARRDSVSVVTTLPWMKKGAIHDFMNISSTLGFPFAFDDADEGSDFVSIEKNDTNYRLNEIRIYENRIPDVKGMSARDALYILENSGCRVTIKGAGRIVEQTPEAGSAITKETQITLVLE